MTELSAVDLVASSNLEVEIVKEGKQARRGTLVKCLVPSLVLSVASLAQNPSFHKAPASAKAEKNPYQGQQTASGKSAFQLRCPACHGANVEGSGNIL
jgi:cytochrome c5